MLILSDLNEDVLSLIFEKCTIEDVLRLYYVCRKFRAIICQYTFLQKSRDLLLVGHRNKQAISYKTTLRDLSYHKRINLYRNWCQGRYEEHIFYNHKFFHPAHIHLERQWLYTTYGGQLRMHRRLKKGILNRRADWTIGEVKQPDVTCFTKKHNVIFAGRRNGCVFIVGANEPGLEEADDMLEERVESDGINSIESIDFNRNLFLTASRATTKFWRQNVELGVPYLEPISEINGGNKCLRISANGQYCATGKYNERSRTALRLIDLETLTERVLGSDTTSIYDIAWERDEYTILTGNYDTTLRLFDVRTNADQSIWTDPYDLSVYCIAYDGNYGVLCGMQYHCRVNLYDLRVPNKYIQLYFPNMRYSGSSGNSPAYCVANDQSQLFISTDHNLRVFDFEAGWAESKDYTNIFVHEMIVNGR